MIEPAGWEPAATEPAADGPGPDEDAADRPGQPLRVSTLELFFDLVFVFAITQLTGILAHHDVTVEDGFRVLLIFGVLWWMYGGYVWLGNAPAPSPTPQPPALPGGRA